MERLWLGAEGGRVVVVSDGYVMVMNDCCLFSLSNYEVLLTFV